MKHVIIIFLFINILSLSATDVSGVQTGTWALEDSPFVVIGDVQIPAGDELTIEPGVSVQFWGDWNITAEGMLIAQGTETDSIYFVRYPTYSGYWDEIRLEQETGDGYEISYCFIRGADNGINSIDAPVYIHDSHLDANMTGIHLFAIGNANPPDVLIENCLIEHSIENGIDIYENGNTIIQNCEITSNGMGTQYRGAIQVNIQTNGAVCSPIIRDNYIHDNNKQGITCTDMFSAGTINVLIQNNQIIGNLTGVYFYNCGGTLQDNQISDNFIPGDMNSGAGVMCYGTLATPMITGNAITGNYTALYITNGANPYMGNTASANPLEQGMNTFQENIDANGVNNSVYVYNCSNTYTIMAENNTWDSEDYADIAVTIHDGEDSPSLPIVDFDPIYAPPANLLSGTFTYSGFEIDNWVFNLFNVNSNLDVEMYPIEYGSFELSMIPSGFYFLIITGTGVEGNIAVGAIGDYFFPDVLSITETSQYTDLELEIFDYEYETHYYVPRIVIEGDYTLYHFVEGGVYPYSQALLYQDGNYLRYYGKPIYTENGWEIEEFVPYNEVYMKINDIQVGDTWESLRLYGGDESVIFDYTVVARDTIEIDSELHESFTCFATYENAFCYQEQYVADIGFFSRLSLTAQDLMEGNFAIDMSTINLTATESSFLPLADDFFVQWMPQEKPLTPWNLTFASGLDDIPILFWNPPAETTACQTYRLYADEEMIAEFPVTNHQYPVPLPIAETTDFYITGYDGTNETEPSNTISWIVPTGEDDNQIPQNITQLQQNIPNPFYTDNSRSGFTRISFHLANDSHTFLDIYNCRGRKIKSLIDKTLTAGDHQFEWDGCTANGSKAASGVYYYKLSAGEFSETRKLLLIR
ncbi:MAG: right-handed parallel beta-helix repeat-containing protein [Candidatus Cloacimonetes bacterium]|nr:right-handed parallel beta-helix repeat-containing protein [Candidatus Cloacimonadota bacterium]